MQMSEAVVLREVEGVTEANRMLAEGWRLLAVTVKTSVGDGFQHTYYVLGKPAQHVSQLPEGGGFQQRVS